MKLCTACGHDVGNVEDDQPCPHCKKPSGRRVDAKHPSAIIAVSGGKARLTVIRHWHKLQAAALNFFNDKEFGIAVVVAATACEVIADRAMGKAFERLSIEQLESPVMNFLVSKSLSHDRNRKLYTALTGDDIVEQPFWPTYKKLVEFRNQSVHSGTNVAEDDARKCLDAARAFTEHVEKVNGLS